MAIDTRRASLRQSLRSKRVHKQDVRAATGVRLRFAGIPTGTPARDPRVLSSEGRMFTIIISEKGGAERRETFDKNEINVGRVQGNDLMLPKGNVSKHHARLLFRDGRFIVTDLKSTNGTYVNGRKIAQATIVREGDKIYIGDFVIRLESPAAGALPETEA